MIGLRNINLLNFIKVLSDVLKVAFKPQMSFLQYFDNME